MSMTMNELDALDNSELESQARSLHGALYKRINSIQRDLNIARETIKNYERRLNEQREIIKNQTRPLTTVTVNMPNSTKPILYKLVPIEE